MKVYRIGNRAIYLGRFSREILFDFGIRIDKNYAHWSWKEITFYFKLGFWFLTISRRY